MSTQPKVIELGMSDLDNIRRRVEAKELREEDYATINAMIDSYVTLYHAVGDKAATIARLRKLCFGSKTEKTAAVLGTSSADPTATTSEAASEESEEASNAKSGGGESRGKGHGRNGADRYTGAEKIEVPHPTLQPGDACPECEKGTVYEAKPKTLVRLVGQPPIGGKVYYLQKLRCGLCGQIFTAPTPEAAGEEKYDATVPAMIALLKYGSGMPFNREERLQGMVGVPLPASTQWDLVHTLAEHAEPVYEELIREAAQGDVVHNDDTTARILESMGRRAEQFATDEKKKGRKGLFTSGIVSTREDRRIALFFTGHNHAGENLTHVLSRRAAELDAPIQMCDALSRNVCSGNTVAWGSKNIPAELKTIVAHCLAHGRRQFVDVADSFPEECGHVLKALAIIYKNDADSRELKHSPQERLAHHQTHSRPTMTELKVWLTQQLEDRLVERNSSLGGAIVYMLKHWDRLTLFLRVPGAPLDNNICERALKKAILHRKNALFYKTHRGAHVGDLFMSLIHTCELGGMNPFDYLTALERHAAAVAANPPAWLPWTYQETLASAP
ncbi:MAG: IS66 family transposase [Phycisphaerales bacterium]|nr:IS66 family transposase [Phycisphaerales bacterium]